MEDIRLFGSEFHSEAPEYCREFLNISSFGFGMCNRSGEDLRVVCTEVEGLKIFSK